MEREARHKFSAELTLAFLQPNYSLGIKGRINSDTAFGLRLTSQKDVFKGSVICLFIK